MTKEFGDFQTNTALAVKVCNLLKKLGVNPKIIIEPTCGDGNFIVAASEVFPNTAKIIGIELQDHYVNQTRRKAESIREKNRNLNVRIIKDNIFTHQFDDSIIGNTSEILLIGNPPWVTNAELMGKNLPKKSNFKRYNGLDAITGKANFDISEYILLHLMKTFKTKRGYLAFLCKTQVARNILQFLPATDFTVGSIKIYLFNAKKEFGASVDACLFVCSLSIGDHRLQSEVYHLDEPLRLIKRFGWYDDKFVSNIDEYEITCQIDGDSQLTWRSGIKHDCSKVMELKIHPEGWLFNKLNEVVDIEEELLYPLLKSSDLKGTLVNKSVRKLIVTQTKPGEDTSYIRSSYPRLWNYLDSHMDFFSKRKSVIYKNAPDFAIFGVGDYSFLPYKVAISGLYKSSKFTLILPENGKTIMVDDSCYFIGLDNLKNAIILVSLLNTKFVQDFLDSIVFLDSKRPYTKDVLMRINILKALELIDRQEILRYVEESILSTLADIRLEDIDSFAESLERFEHDNVVKSIFQ